MRAFAPACFIVLLGAGCFVDAIGVAGSGGGGGDPGEGGQDGGSASEGGSGQGGLGFVPVCGDGLVDGGEACDTGEAPSEGCVDCAVVAGWECGGGEPSQCLEIPPVVGSTVLQPHLFVNDTVDHYDGTIGSMDCVDVDIEDHGYTEVRFVTAQIAMFHEYVGDLVIKVVPPSGAPVATVLSRPGIDEPSDTYYDVTGSPPNLEPGFPITFDDGTAAMADAEVLGVGLGGTDVVCRDGGALCTYHSNPGAATGAGLADFVGPLTPGGTWRLCFGDGSTGSVGEVSAVKVTVLAW